MCIAGMSERTTPLTHICPKWDIHHLTKVENSYFHKRKRLQKAGFLHFLWYNGITFEMVGVIGMSIIAGILVCAFVYVIRESLTAPGEEDYEG